MNPPSVRDTLELVNQYGIALVLVVILVLFFIGTFVIMLRWVMRNQQEHMKSTHTEKIALAELVNTGLRNLNDGLHQNTLLCQDISRTHAASFERILAADNYHRSDLEEIKKKLNGLDRNCPALKKGGE